MVRLIRVVGFWLLVSIVPATAATETVFTYRAPESERDTRYQYDTAVLKLALEKTVSKYGAFRLQASPPMNFARAISALQQNTYPNFFIKLSYEDELVHAGKATYARFPVDLGIVGYRVCFANEDSKRRVANAKSLDDLRKLTMGQGQGWADVTILRSNGFQVVEVSAYESLFRMVALGRFDLLCRGTNELLEELESHKDIAGLTYDEAISIAYPLPRFFFTHAANQQAAERIEEGLLLAYKDGSLQKEWIKNYRRSIDFVRLEKRRIFWIDNPLLKNLNFNYRQYFFDPLSERSTK